MPFPLYQASVPVFLRYLSRLDALVATAASHSDAPALLAARLAPDMQPFASQVAMAAGFTLRACFPLAGRPVPPAGEFPATYQGLRERIAHTVRLLMSLECAEFDGAAGRTLDSRAGKALVSLKGDEFLLQYALPNFFFHMTTAYAILRHHGVGVGKQDFDGWHAY